MKSPLQAWIKMAGWLGIGTGSLALALAAPTYAGPIQTRGISFGGSACAAGSTSISGNSEIKIVFRNWTSYGMDRSNCALTIPVVVPRGMQVGLPTITYKGRTSGAVLTTETFFAGDTGPMTTYPVSGGFAVKDVSLGWSPCGGSVNVRVNAGLMNHIGTGQVTSMTLSKLPTRRCQ